MFTEQLPAALFQMQREFIAAMGGKLDFRWAANTLVVEETKELKEAYDKKELSDENLAEIFKELADVIYVVAHFYNVMPVYAPELLSQEDNQKIQNIMDDAADTVSKVTNTLQIPMVHVLQAFEIVHLSNMSKLDEEGKPVRRDDGKIMKGPKYQKPDMMPLVKAFKAYLVEKNKQEMNNDSKSN